jgi:pimeloyl-ACP methyl ester carboxylesterase
MTGPPTIGVLGSGPVGRGFATLLSRAGYEVTLGTRHPEAPGLAELPAPVRISGFPEAATRDVVFIAPAGDADLYVKIQADGPFPGFAACFANDLPANTAAVLAATQLPIAASALSERSSVPAWTTIPSWALIGTADHVIPAAEQLFMARCAHAHIVTVSASHLSMISHPGPVAGLILTAAQATS